MGAAPAPRVTCEALSTVIDAGLRRTESKLWFTCSTQAVYAAAEIAAGANVSSRRVGLAVDTLTLAFWPNLESRKS